MTEKFESKQLNKKDHEKVDKEANAGRVVAKVVAVFASVVTVLKFFPWEKIKNTVADVAKNVKA